MKCDLCKREVKLPTHWILINPPINKYLCTECYLSMCEQIIKKELK